MNSEAFVLAAGSNPEEWLRRLRVDMPRRTGARDYFERALSGCCESAATAAGLAIDRGLFGAVCVGLYFAHARPDPLRAALGMRWQWRGGYRQVVSAADAAGGVLIPMLRSAAFPTRLLPETLTVWRYAFGDPDHALSVGRSWSTYRAPIVAMAFELGTRRSQPYFVGRRTIRRDDVVLYLPADSGDPAAFNEIVFDAPPGGDLETRSDIDAMGIEWLAMLKTPRMRPALARYYGGPDLPAWGAPSWRADAADLMRRIRSDPGAGDARETYATDGHTADLVARLGSPLGFSFNDPAGSWNRMP